MPLVDYKQQSEQVQHFLTQCVEEVAALSQFGERKSKLEAATFAQGMILGLLQTPNASLNEIAHCCSQLGVDITKQGLAQRLDASAVLLLAGLLQKGLAYSVACRLPLPVLRYFSAVWVLDSTQIALPASLQQIFLGVRQEYPCLKVQLSLDYLSGNLGALQWEQGRTPDQNCRLHVELAQPHSLHLFDLGYFKQEVFQQLAQRDSYFISRLQSQSALFDPETGQRLDLAQQVRRQRTPLQEYQWHIGQRVHLPVRVIVRRVPDAVAQQRRRKAKQKARKQKKNCTAAYLTLLGFDLFITNVPASELDSETICLLYRIRWQAELQFKAWKSQLAVGVLGDWHVERVLCYLYAHFVGIVLLHLWLAPYRALPDGELSWTKAIQVLQKTLHALFDAIAAGWEGVCRFFQRLEADLQRFARKDKRRKSPSTFSRLRLVNP